jgi:hypothetical protein
MNAEATAELTRVLVVEDDRGIAESLVRGLRQAGYAAEDVRSGGAALAAASRDVVLLDLGLQDIDGVEVCRRPRARSDAVKRTGWWSWTKGPSPTWSSRFGLAELLARIRQCCASGARPAGPEVVLHGPLTLDLRTPQVSVRGRAVALTPENLASWHALPPTPAGWLDVISLGQSAVTYEGRGDGCEGKEVFRLALVAAVQAAAAGQPGHGPLHHSAVPAQPPGGLDALAGKAVPDAAGGGPSPQVAVVVSLVTVQLGWPSASRAAT